MMKSSLANSPRESLDPTSLAALVVEGCAEAKGQEIVALDMRGISDFADYFIVASGRSDRQTQGIANRVMETAARAGVKPLVLEGYDQGHWILVDFGDVVLHVFYEPLRTHYNLEGLWSQARRVDISKLEARRSVAGVRAAVA